MRSNRGGVWDELKSIIFRGAGGVQNKILTSDLKGLEHEIIIRFKWYDLRGLS
jgi:hypothetical protein